MKVEISQGQMRKDRNKRDDDIIVVPEEIKM